jgi:hypothetical protein
LALALGTFDAPASDPSADPSGRPVRSLAAPLLLSPLLLLSLLLPPLGGVAVLRGVWWCSPAEVRPSASTPNTAASANLSTWCNAKHREWQIKKNARLKGEGFFF